MSLLPFLGDKIVIPPLMNRLVVFRSDYILHRVERCWCERFCITIWIDGPFTNNQKEVQLRLSKSSLSSEEIENTVDILKESPLQRSISRLVYKEEYQDSLIDCMGNSHGSDLMLQSHLDHLEIAEKSASLMELVNILREKKSTNVFEYK